MSAWWVFLERALHSSIWKSSEKVPGAAESTLSPRRAIASPSDFLVARGVFTSVPDLERTRMRYIRKCKYDNEQPDP